MFAAVQVLSGDDPPQPTLLDSMVAAETTSFLLIAAGTNDLEVEFNELFAETVGVRAELWVVPGASHTKGFQKDPAAYEARVIGFFEGAMGG
jgi:hypothetical protein